MPSASPCASDRTVSHGRGCPEWKSNPERHGTHCECQASDVEEQPNDRGKDNGAPEPRQVDDCEKLGTLFGELNKCLRNVGFNQMVLGDKSVEPVVIVFFWIMIWFLGFQALGLVGVLCLAIIFMQK